MIRIMIADDHSIVRSGIRQILETQRDFSIIGEAGSGSEALAQLRQGRAEILLTDLSMPGLAGPDLIRRVRSEFPEVRVLILSMHNEAQFVSRTLKAGASGFVTKDSDPQVLFDALRKVSKGGRYIDPALVDAMVFGGDADAPPHAVLSDREFEVLQGLCQGLSLNEISTRLHISAKTVGTHKTRLMQKLSINNNAELIRYGLQHKLDSPIS